MFLIFILYGKEKIVYEEIMNRTSLEKGIRINCSGALAFFEYLGYVSLSGKNVIVLDKLNSLNISGKDVIISSFVEECLNRITNDGLFDSNTVNFESNRGGMGIKKSAFPLSYAAIRNFLIDTGVLEKEMNGENAISELHENAFSTILRERREKLNLEQLIQKQNEQNQRGLEAEEYIVKYERNRVPNLADKIKRISDFDVTAGYDIVSFKNLDSSTYDRFVEVKSYIGSPHFYWSENEVDVAKVKGEKYILCLVDYNRIHEEGYEPEFIINPFEIIFNDSQWLVDTASFKIKKI